MADYGPNAQRRYFPQAPSTTSLIPPTGPKRSSGGSSTSSHSSFANPRFASGPPSDAHSSLNDSRFDINVSRRPSMSASISEKFSLSADPASWGADLSPAHAEPDDFLHNPDPKRDRKLDSGGNIFTWRGFTNLGCIIFLALAITTLFAGYPLATYLTKNTLSTFGGFNIGGINATGQIPSMPGDWSLVDVDTPKAARFIKSFHNPSEELQLVFSDEFNQDGRTFYPGDDPYWEAVDLHYWATDNLEWYDPGTISTSGGSLKIKLSKVRSHNMSYEGGMMSTWNKFCFTGGLIVTSVVLPGANNVAGLWPAVWTMGNLGRAGYGASLDGMWPYTYDACDVGTAPNQTFNNLPQAALEGGDNRYGGELSFLPGQRLSRCTCEGESHPGPKHSDGTYVGRSAPEIDIIEPQVVEGVGKVSLSAQWAPFNAEYKWDNNAANQVLIEPSVIDNGYKGGVFQQATSGLADADQDCYETAKGCFAVYGFEYKPGFDDAYITWINNNQLSWTLHAPGMGPDPRVQISARPIPQEPMYILVNLGISNSFGDVDFEHLEFPATMSIDYIRVYQPKNKINIGCDPKDFPTQAYINEYIEAYSNPNLTTWEDDYKQPFPKNRFLGQC